MTSNEVKNELIELKNDRFNTTKYWNDLNGGDATLSNWGLADSESNNASNRYGDAEECYGFALFLAHYLFGSQLEYDNINDTCDGHPVIGAGEWTLYKSDLQSFPIQPGDIIRTYSGHSAMVREVCGDGNFKVAECLGNGKCRVAWDYWSVNNEDHPVSIATVLADARYILKAPTEDAIAPEVDNTTYKITNVGASKCLNIRGNNLFILDNAINVVSWHDTGSNEQKWVVYELDENTHIRSAIDKSFGLNVYRSGSPFNCNIRKIAGNETDASVDIIADGESYKVKLHNYDLYLTVGNSNNDSNIYWDSASDSDYQKWIFTEINF